MYQKDMDMYKEKIKQAFRKSLTSKYITTGEILKDLDERKENFEEDLNKVIQEIYEHGYEDGINEKEHEQENEPVPWEDLD